MERKADAGLPSSAERQIKKVNRLPPKKVSGTCKLEMHRYLIFINHIVPQPSPRREIIMIGDHAELGMSHQDPESLDRRADERDER